MSAPLRVCLISKYLYPHDTRLRQQALALGEMGSEVDIICLRGDGQPPVERRGRVTAYRVMRPTPKDSMARYLLTTLRFTLAAWIRLQRLALRHRPDVIVAHTLPEFLVFVGSVQKLFGVPLALDVRDVSLELFESKWGADRMAKLRPVLKLAERLSFRISDHWFVASPGFRDRLVQRLGRPEKFSLLYNTADTRVFSPCPERPFDRIESGARLFYHGTMAERFGVDVAIQALAELRKTIPGSTLDAYGPCDADYRRRLDQLIADLALKDCVRLHEPVSLERIRRVLDNADLGIVPYQRDDFMELAFSTKMFEYAASGLPIVASRLRPALLVFDDSCVAYATPGNPVSFARHAAALCLAPDRRRKMAENAFKAHESVSGDVMAARYRAVIRGLASGRRGEIADEAGRADAAEGAMPR